MSVPGLHSFGKELRWCQLDGIRISETMIPAGLRLDMHSHEPGQICFVLEGEYGERASDGDNWFRPGMLQFHTPGERHSNVVSPESEVLTLLISINADRWIQIARRSPPTANTILTDCACQVRRELGRIDDAARAALEGWAMLSLSLVARQMEECPQREPPWLHDAVAIIQQHAEDSISLSTVAAAVDVHPATLAAGFRRFRKISVGESIRQQRVQRVMRLLVNSKMPLCEIATKCGFHDQAHMGRVFRNAIGISPGAYRSLRE
jgi:AraC family transcriptional regulator